MIAGCEKDGAFFGFIKKKGSLSVYFDFEGGALYRITENGEALGYMLLKGPSAYLLFEREPSEEAVSEIAELFSLMGIKETVSDKEVFSEMTALYVLELEELFEKSADAEIKTASGRGYDECFDLLLLAGFSLPEKDEFYINSFERAKKGAPTFYIPRENGVAATASVIAVNEDKALLGAVATHPESRGRGYAGALVSHAAKAALNAGKTPVITYFAENAGRIYKSIGFKEKAVLYKKTL